MKDNHFKNKIFILSLGILLVSCAQQTSPSTSSADLSSEPSSSESEKVTDMKDAFVKLQKAKNYDVVTSVEYPDGDKFSYTWYFNPDYVYCDYESFEEGYACFNGDVFRFNLYNESFVVSDSYGISSLWGSEFVRTLALDPSVFDGISGNEVVLTKKTAKLQWLEFLEIGKDELVNIKEAKIELLGDTLSSLKFTMSFEEATFVSTIEHVGNGGDAGVEEFLELHQKPATYPEDLLYAKQDFALNNFIRVIEDELTVSEDPKTIVGYEYYLPNYFYTQYLEESGYSIMSSGYLSLHKKKLETDSGDAEFNGAYYFALSSDLSELAAFLASGPAFVTNTYDMPSIMNYPSLMSMWEHNFQFFEKTEDLYGAPTYITYSDAILYEFYYFSQIAAVLPEDYATRSLRSLSISIDKGETEAVEDDHITFLFEVKNDGEKFFCEYKYQQFGNANIETVETLASLFVDAE